MTSWSLPLRLVIHWVPFVDQSDQLQQLLDKIYRARFEQALPRIGFPERKHGVSVHRFLAGALTSRQAPPLPIWDITLEGDIISY